jgi:hypothetical protein
MQNNNPYMFAERMSLFIFEDFLLKSLRKRPLYLKPDVRI